MSFNVENLFIEYNDQAKVAELVETYWRNSSQPLQPDWGLPSSFEPLLANEQKRKLALSPSRDSWIALIESKQIVDFALAKTLSEQLKTTVLVVQLFEISGESGYASALRGQLLESHFDENDDPLGSVREVLKKYKVPFDVVLFREAVQKIAQGWIVKQKDKS